MTVNEMKWGRNYDFQCCFKHCEQLKMKCREQSDGHSTIKNQIKGVRKGNRCVCPEVH